MFEMRAHLKPARLTIAMWDAAYMTRRSEGDSFHDWDRVIDELLERGYNTVRIDAFPGIIDPDDLDLEYTWPDRPDHVYMPWLWYRAYTTKPGRDLVEFLRLAQTKGLYVTLSSWWEFSSLRVVPSSAAEATDMWIKLLDMIRREVGFSHILFVDLCNEIPGFLPGFLKKLEEARHDEVPDAGQQTALAAAPVKAGRWNSNQLAFLKTTLDAQTAKAQRHFPELRFTWSMNMIDAFSEVGFENLDVLDIHFFLTDPRFDARTKFDEFVTDCYTSSQNFKEFSDRCRQTINAIGPMLRQKQRQQLAWGRQFSERIGAPLVTTESWASWFYVDHADLDWTWIKHWCETAVDDALEFGLWGMSTCNYAEPMFEIWQDKAWHQRLNAKFLNS